MTDLSRLDHLEGLAPTMPAGLRSEVERYARERKRTRRRKYRNRLAVGCLTAAAFTSLAFTPAGRTATGWIAESVGISDEPPTLPQVRSVPDSARVIGRGELDDGTRFELIAKRNSSFGGPGGLICFQVDWIDLRNTGQGGACTQSHVTGRANDPALETGGIATPPPTQQPVQKSALYFGLADDLRINSVQLRAVDEDGATDLPTEMITVPPGTPANNGTYPVSVYAAPLSADIVMAGGRGELDLVASGYDANGQLINELTYPTESAVGPPHPPPDQKALETLGGEASRGTPAP